MRPAIPMRTSYSANQFPAAGSNIVGLPLNMDGTEQPLTARARKFANRIHGRFGVEVKLHDERLSTVEARSGLFEQGGYRALNKGKVDSASAVIILESYFEQGY